MLITIGEVIPMVLTIYMTDPNLPLPSRNEVLLCTDHTTKEEVSFELKFREKCYISYDKPRCIFHISYE